MLYNLNSLLQIQQLHYAFYVIEPQPDQMFNRGKLLNVGYREAMKDFAWNCTISHDVDLIPESLNISYGCPYKNPRHLSAHVDKFKYVLVHNLLLGGVSSFTREQFEKSNGYSNQFWGWGGEDDELSSR